MKKYISILLVVFLLAATLTACGGKENKTVSTDGSTSMQKVMLALGEAFMNNNSGTTVTYNGTGSGTGIKAVKDGLNQPFFHILHCLINKCTNFLEQKTSIIHPHYGFACCFRTTFRTAFRTTFSRECSA